LVHLDAGEAGLGHGGHVGNNRMALRSRDRQHAQRPVVDVGFGRDVEKNIMSSRLATMSVAAGATPRYGTCTSVVPVCSGQQHAEQMSAGADALRSVAQPARLRLGERDQLLADVAGLSWARSGCC
jgi:hypothetical protein